MKKNDLRIRISRLNDGDSTRLGATADLGELLTFSDGREKMTKFESDYKSMLERLNEIRKISDTNVITKWKIADTIFSFLQSAKRNHVAIESHLQILCRDTSISRTELKYLLKFRKTYSIDELDRKTPWSTYRSMLYKKIPYGKSKRK